MNDDAGQSRGSTAGRMVFGLALIGAIVAVYWKSFGAPFLFDDERAIWDNPSIRSLHPISAVLVPPRELPTSGRPLVNLSFALNYAVDGLRPAGYHIVNVALHVLCALLLVAIVRDTLRSGRLAARFDGAADGVAMVVGAVWALHPLLTDAVAYSTQRSELMVSLFLLLTLGCCIRGWKGRAAARAAWFGCAVVACAAGMACKEVMVAAPLIVWLYDRTFVSGRFGAALKHSRWLYVGLMITWGMLVFLLLGKPRSASVGFHAGVSWWDYLCTQTGVVSWYLRLCLWPTPLSVAHDWPIARGFGQVWPQAALIVALLALTVLAIIRRPAVGFPAACFWMILAPTSSVVPIVTEPVAERRMYLPLAALVALVVPWAWSALRSHLSLRTARVTGVTASVVLVAALAQVAAARVDEFSDGIGVWRSASVIYPQYDFIWNNLGLALSRVGRRDEAIECYGKAVGLDPRNYQARMNLAMKWLETGRTGAAAMQLRESLGYTGRDLRSTQRIAMLLEAIGYRQDALAAFDRAVRMNDEWVEGLNRFAWIRATDPSPELRDGRMAVSLAERACALTGNASPECLDTLSAAYAECGRFDDAIQTGSKAFLLARQRNDDKTAAQIEQSIRLYEQRQPVRAARPGQ
ncbi:MAG: tetratricopeptide repeat protein [Tepidisphaeraceae bacterium]